jgi:hypothetical protein
MNKRQQRQQQQQHRMGDDQRLYNLHIFTTILRHSAASGMSVKVLADKIFYCDVAAGTVDDVRHAHLGEFLSACEHVDEIAVRFDNGQSATLKTYRGAEQPSASPMVDPP